MRYSHVLLIGFSVLSAGCIAERLPYSAKGGNECVWEDNDGGLHETGDPSCDVDSSDAGIDASRPNH